MRSSRRALQSAAATVAFILLNAAIAGDLPAQVPTLDVGKRTARTPYAFGYVSGMAEMKDGRVVVSDSKQRVFRLVDFRTNEMPVLGEPGDQPLQYRSVGPVIPWNGDSVLLYTRGNAGESGRYLHVTPTGTIVAESEVASPRPEKEPENGIYTYKGPLGVDKDGSSYFLLELLDSTITYYELADVVQVSPDGSQRKVVDYLRERRKDQVFPREMTVRPFMFRDAWAVRQDGLAARIVADTYEVVWSRNGKETGRTGPLPFTPIPITEAEQTAYRDSMIDRFNPKPAPDGGKTLAPGSAGGSISRMGTSASPTTTRDNSPRAFNAPPATTLKIPHIAPYPDRKPAIPDRMWQTVAAFDPAGRLWVVRERAHGDDTPHVDIIAEGRGIIGHVNLPKNSHLAGFGANSVYVVTHDDGGDWLERYAMPTLP